jgi:PhzF family phenazine biosynthesis protein
MVDAMAFLYECFPAARFGGNTAGVVLLQHPASPSWMQGVAADLGAPTTGFVDLPSARHGCAEVRFFTPHQEIDACGRQGRGWGRSLLRDALGLVPPGSLRHPTVKERPLTSPAVGPSVVG